MLGWRGDFRELRLLDSFVSDDVDVFLTGVSGSGLLRRLFLFCCDDVDDVDPTRDELDVRGEPTGERVSMSVGCCCCCSDSSFRRVCGVRPGPPLDDGDGDANDVTLLFRF